MRLLPAPGLAVVADGDAVYVALVPHGRPLALTDSAAVIWSALPGSVDEVVARVAADYAVEPDAVREDVGAFLDRLVVQGVLVADAPDPATAQP